ncbi:hypothetical protein ACHAXM_008076 [Skeletonema potamos]|jgi:23S rRNA-/tRNA-specific pseudouridylate synthase
MKNKIKHNRKRSRSGIGCLIAEEEECNNDESSRSASSLLSVEVVPLSRALSLITQHNNLHCQDQTRVRIVHPYAYTFATFAKTRWLGRPLIDVYHDEFGSYPKCYYEAAIKTGRILVSGKKVTCDYSIKHGDELTHTVHRHEPAVGLGLSDHHLSSVTTSRGNETEVESPPIDIVYEDDTILVVDKPASLPVHSCGSYHYNSLLEVLAHWKEAYGAGKLFTVHRLDRLTSGLVLIAKSASLAKSLGKCILERDGCEKVYLARVKGQFPSVLENANHPWRMQYWSSAKVEQDVEAEESSEMQSKLRKIASMPPILHGEVSVHDKSNMSGGVHVELRKKTKGGADENRSGIAALGFWVTDRSGNLVENANFQDFMKQCENMTTNEIIEYAVGSTLTNEADDNLVSKKQSIRWLHFACPCRISSHKNGVCEAGDFSAKTESELKGTKPAQTAFTLLSYDETSDTSLLLVKPDTGRMHQIRLHLHALGHPIANDHCYGGELWFGDDEGQQSFRRARDWLDRLDKRSSGAELTISNAPATDEEIYHVVANKSRDDGESIEDFIVKTCVWCARCRGVDAINCFDGSTEAKVRNEEAVFQRTLMEYLVRSQGIWLHALQYSLHVNDEKGSRVVKYKTTLPSWACTKQNYDE